MVRPGSKAGEKTKIATFRGNKLPCFFRYCIPIYSVYNNIQYIHPQPNADKEQAGGGREGRDMLPQFFYRLVIMDGHIVKLI